MEYLYYVLAVLAIIAVCLYAVRIPGHQRLTGRPVDLAERARRRSESRQDEARREANLLKQRKAVLQRELQSVPTPWGWPGSERLHGADADDEGAHVSPLHRWIDGLIREKRTVDSEEYLAHRQACVRALLEDRFGRSPQPREISYNKVVPPRLRDPAEPHDQQDNFPSGKAEQIVSKLSRQPGRPTTGAIRLKSSGPLREIRKPWGW